MGCLLRTFVIVWFGITPFNAEHTIGRKTFPCSHGVYYEQILHAAIYCEVRLF